MYLSSPKQLLWVWIILCYFLLATSVCAQSTPSPHFITVIPFTTFLDWGSPIVDVKLNDKVTARFLLDTASNTSVVSEAIAAKLGLTPQPAMKDGQPYLMGGRQGRSVMLSEMQLGSLAISQPIPFVVSEKNQLSSFPHPIDGILGLNILSFFIVTFDFPHHQITLWNSAGLSQSEIKNCGFAGMTALSITPREDGIYTVSAVVSGNTSQLPTSLIVDTGAAETSATADVARLLQLKPDGEQSNGTYWGQIRYTQTQASKLQLGDLKLTNVRLVYAADGDPRFPCGLGMDILSSCKMLLDFSSKKMYLLRVVPAVSLGAATKTPKKTSP